MSSKRQEVKIFLTPEERHQLDLEAEVLGVPRGALIRERAIAYRSGAVHLDYRGYSEALAKAAQTVSGIPRTQLEAIVATVITTISNAQKIDPASAVSPDQD
jgi:hypothetical protein